MYFTIFMGWLELLTVCKLYIVACMYFYPQQLDLSDLTVAFSLYRSIKNRTGIDINVPSYEPANSPRNVQIYHVVVISNLPHFKLPEHNETDVVQFMVCYFPVVIVIVYWFI